MTTIMPEGEAIRNAVKWISEQCREHPGTKTRKWINEACMRFNLSPKDEEFLFQLCREKK